MEDQQDTTPDERTFGKQKPKRTAPGRKAFSRRQWTAAAFILVVSTFSIWFFRLRQNEGERLYARYYRQYPGFRTTGRDSVFGRAMADYNAGSYAAALKIWTEQLLAKPDNDTLLYFIGVASLARKDFSQSIEHFKKVVPQMNGYFYRDANWYLGMALIHENRKAEAIQFLAVSDHAEKDALIARLIRP